MPDPEVWYHKKFNMRNVIYVRNWSSCKLYFPFHFMTTLY